MTDRQLFQSTLQRARSGALAFRVSAEHYLWLANEIDRAWADGFCQGNEGAAVYCLSELGEHAEKQARARGIRALRAEIAKTIPVVDQSQIVGHAAPGTRAPSVVSSDGPNSEFDSRDGGQPYLDPHGKDQSHIR